MIYIVAIFLPPIALLYEACIVSAFLNLFILIPFCILLAFWLPFALLVPGLHAILVIWSDRRHRDLDRKHRELVDAIRRGKL
jgi:hypothetical protein